MRAAELYNEAAQLFPNSQTALLGLSELAYGEGRLSEAASITTQMLQVVDKEEPWWSYILGEWWHFEPRLIALRARVAP